MVFSHYVAAHFLHLAKSVQCAKNPKGMLVKLNNKVQRLKSRNSMNIWYSYINSRIPVRRDILTIEQSLYNNNKENSKNQIKYLYKFVTWNVFQFARKKKRKNEKKRKNTSEFFVCVLSHILEILNCLKMVSVIFREFGEYKYLLFVCIFFLRYLLQSKWLVVQLYWHLDTFLSYPEGIYDVLLRLPLYVTPGNSFKVN